MFAHPPLYIFLPRPTGSSKPKTISPQSLQSITCHSLKAETDEKILSSSKYFLDNHKTIQHDSAHSCWVRMTTEGVMVSLILRHAPLFVPVAGQVMVTSLFGVSVCLSAQVIKYVSTSCYRVLTNRNWAGLSRCLLMCNEKLWSLSVCSTSMARPFFKYCIIGKTIYLSVFKSLVFFNFLSRPQPLLSSQWLIK